MIISECMTKNVLCVRQDETADVAARLLSRGNIGAVPVLDRRDRVVGMLTDRDLVLRCMAAHGIWTDGAPLPAGLALFGGTPALPYTLPLFSQKT